MLFDRFAVLEGIKENKHVRRQGTTWESTNVASTEDIRLSILFVPFAERDVS